MRYWITVLIFLFSWFESSLSAVEKEGQPCTVVIFGASGDLTARKLLPALYNLSFDGKIAKNVSIIGFARGSGDHKAFRKKIANAVDQFSRRTPNDPAFWQNFEQNIYYNQSDFDDDAGYEALKELLAELDQENGSGGNRLFFLATPPKYFVPIVKKLKEHGLIYEADQSKKWSRVILEKPFGSDFESAVVLKNEMARALDPSQIFLIDHYLGKEGVQNLLTFRFENILFEPVWNNRYIDNIQITLSEEIGIGSRGSFWEETGSLRDLLQNHLLQILSLVAMEPPKSLSSNEIQKEKIKVLEAIRTIHPSEINSHVVIGQYGPGIINGTAVPGYRQETGVSPSSRMETYLAAKLYIDNCRWSGVPFYLRTGKRLPKQTTEIAVTFKKSENETAPNVLFIRIQPNPSIFLKMAAKVPSLDYFVKPVLFGFSSEKYFKNNAPEAYEKLIYDSIRNDRSLFVSIDEHLLAWKILMPILEYWKTNKQPTIYPAGSWGPPEADHLLYENGGKWKELKN